MNKINIHIESYENSPEVLQKTNTILDRWLTFLKGKYINFNNEGKTNSVDYVYGKWTTLRYTYHMSPGAYMYVLPQ